MRNTRKFVLGKLALDRMGVSPRGLNHDELYQLLKDEGYVWDGRRWGMLANPFERSNPVRKRCVLRGIWPNQVARFQAKSLIGFLKSRNYIVEDNYKEYPNRDGKYTHIYIVYFV